MVVKAYDVHRPCRMISIVALATVVLLAGGWSQNLLPTGDWEVVSGWVERREGDDVVIRRPDGRLVIVDVGRLALDVTRVLRPGRDVVMYGPRRADGAIVARGLDLDYDADAGPAASPRAQ